MTATGTMDAEEFGFWSPHWMLKKSLGHVPHAFLYKGVISVIDYLVESDELELEKILDILAQVSLTGTYVPTEFSGGGVTVVGYVYDGDGDIDPPITEDEIADFRREMDESADGKNPYDDGKKPFRA